MSLGATACSPLPVPATQAATGLGFRLVVETGQATLVGVVRAPASLLSREATMFVADAKQGRRLAEVPVPDATVVSLDGDGRPRPDGAVVRTDAQGRFVVRGWRLGEPGFLQVTFDDVAGRPQVLSAYVRPESEPSCGDVSLSTSFLAARISDMRDQDPLFSADRLGRIADMIDVKLPGLLDAALQDAPERARLDGIEPWMAGLLGELGQQDAAKRQASAASLLARVFDQDPAVHQAFQQALETFLDVSFSVRSMGLNTAPVVREERIRHVLIGRAELLCRDGEAEMESVTFWLNNGMVAQGRFADGVWLAELDSRAMPDGPYVLSAVARPRRPAPAPVTLRAFLYVKNTRPAGELSCSPPTAIEGGEARP